MNKAVRPPLLPSDSAALSVTLVDVNTLATIPVVGSYASLTTSNFLFIEVNITLADSGVPLTSLLLSFIQNGTSDAGLSLYVATPNRFLSPDDPSFLDGGAREGANPYCYCRNDPVTYSDPNGDFPVATLVLATIAGALITGGLEFGKQLISNNKLNWWEIGSKTLLGAASGFALGVGGAVGAAALGSVSLSASAAAAWTGIAAAVNFSAGVGGYLLHTAGSDGDYNFASATLWGFGQLGRGAVSYVAGFAMGAAGLWKMGSTNYFKNLGPHRKVGAFAKTVRDSVFYRTPVRFVMSYFPNLWLEDWFV